MGCGCMKRFPPVDRREVQWWVDYPDGSTEQFPYLQKAASAASSTGGEVRRVLVDPPDAVSGDDQ